MRGIPGTFMSTPDAFFGSTPSSMMSNASTSSTITIDPEPGMPANPWMSSPSYGCILTLSVGDDFTVLNSMTDLSSLESSTTSCVGLIMETGLTTTPRFDAALSAVLAESRYFGGYPPI